ncbi:J domain-containing protein [Tautonia sociabilis]|uniref:J domain-containing protein n=1 Tax=Tautonia sociabilis TaxID=2080755 RepID=A0A432MGL5_9BACT|nr:J domain-containing protein [Tautonia sociabilis]RUL85904.1 J domain-containing protein [Tautonia sociabilis]
MLDGLDLDPHDILGIDRQADASAIQEAFRRKSKKHHPDLGGDEWAFRIVVRAYELLTRREFSPFSGPFPSRPPHDYNDSSLDPDPGPVVDWAADAERVRPGVKDRDYPPSRMVLVEVLWLRLEVSDIYALLDRREPTSFSGSLHLTWPDPEAGLDGPIDPEELHAVLSELADAFDQLRSRPGVQNARSQSSRGRFEAWLSFPSGREAWTAFTALRPLLNARGLGVRQLTRELTIPRDPDGAPSSR